MVSVLYLNSHFAVSVIDVKEKQVLIYDGLRHPICDWNLHVLTVLKCSNLTSRCARHKFSESRGTVSLDVDEQTWEISPDHFYKQVDGHSCGPIACLKVMDVFLMRCVMHDGTRCEAQVLP